MEKTVEPLDLTDVRMYLQLPDSDDPKENALLLQFISMARTRLENLLPYYLSKRTDTLYGKGLNGFTQCKDGITRIVSAVKILDGGLREPLDVGYPLGREMSFEPFEGMYRITVATDVYCPYDIRNALLIMVRNLWEDRTADPLTDEVMDMMSCRIGYGGML